MKIESMKTKEDLIKAMEKRFDQVFGTTLWQEHKETKPYPGEASQYISCGETVKEFIRSELSLYQNHIREFSEDELRVMKIDYESLVRVGEMMNRQVLGSPIMEFRLDADDKIREEILEKLRKLALDDVKEIIK